MLLQGTSYSSAKMSLVLCERSCKAKVSYLGLQFVIQENITCFYVSMDYSDFRLLMEVRKTFCHPLNDIDPLFPV